MNDSEDIYEIFNKAFKEGKYIQFEVDLNNIMMFHNEDFTMGYDLAEEYSKNPASFHEDPITLARHPNGLIHVLDGQHRFNHAYRKGNKTILAFIFDVPEILIEYLCAPHHALKLHST